MRINDDVINNGYFKAGITVYQGSKCVRVSPDQVHCSIQSSVEVPSRLPNELSGRAGAHSPALLHTTPHRHHNAQLFRDLGEVMQINCENRWNPKCSARFRRPPP